MSLALLFVIPATAANDTPLSQLRACRGVAVAAIADTPPCRPARAAFIPTAGRRQNKQPAEPLAGHLNYQG
jgi:hypothetical protein